MKHLILGVGVLACLTVPAAAHADNNMCTGAILLVPDGSAYTSTFTTDESRWFRFAAKAGRSYAVMTQNDSPTDVQGSVYIGLHGADCSATPLGENFISTYDVEPIGWDYGIGATRGSFKFSSSGGDKSVFLYVYGVVGGKYSIRIQETTLFSNWFFVGGDYMAFTLLRNTTASTVSYVINWRNSNGAIIASQTGVLTPNGSVFKNGGDFPAVLAAVSGTVDVAHTGTPDAIVASTTVLSATTGLSFDAPFLRRMR
jgi:hypothetical protein